MPQPRPAASIVAVSIFVIVIFLAKPANGSLVAYEDGFTALEMTRGYDR